MTASRFGWTIALLVLAGAALTACGEGSGGAEEPLRIYTSVTQATVDEVVAGFQRENPDTEIDVFRAPTGELAARIAAELRDDALRADILWLTDPLSIQQYSRDGLLREWEPADVDVVAEEYRTSTFFGTRILNLVIVASSALADPPSDWAELSMVDGEVAVPDPDFAGSAFAALGFFALSPDYGLDYYRRLSDNGAVQVQSPGDVVNGVAEGLYSAGITLDLTARTAVEDGSPVTLVWPDSGAIALFSPIAVVDRSQSGSAERFVEYVLTEDAQIAIASTGWEPIRDDVDWSESGTQQSIDWGEAFDRQEELLEGYRSVMGS